MGKASIYKPNSCGFHLNHSKKGRQTNQPTNIYSIFITFTRIDLQASKDPEIDANAFAGVENMEARLKAEKDAPTSSCPLGNSQEQEAWGSECVAVGSFPMIPHFDSFLSLSTIYIYIQKHLYTKYRHRYEWCLKYQVDSLVSELPLLVPCQTAIKLKRFLESLLQKSGKLRSLARDLKENYSSGESTAECLDHIIQILYVDLFYGNGSDQNRPSKTYMAIPSTEYLSWGTSLFCRKAWRTWMLSMTSAMQCTSRGKLLRGRGSDLSRNNPVLLIKTGSTTLWKTLGESAVRLQLWVWELLCVFNFIQVLGKSHAVHEGCHHGVRASFFVSFAIWADFRRIGSIYDLWQKISST